MSSVSPFSAAHRSYVKSLYKRYLVNSLDWTIRRDLWRPRALEIRARFEQNRCVEALRPCALHGLLGNVWECVDVVNRNVHDPRALAALFEQAENELAAIAHPDPYIRESLVVIIVLAYGRLHVTIDSIYVSWWNKMVCEHCYK